MSMRDDGSLLEALLDSWDRNNTILVNLLRAVPEGGLEARAAEGSPSVAEMFAHMHYVRLVFLSEDVPEFAGALPEKEWGDEHDRDRIAGMLNESARAVRDAVKNRIESRREMKEHYDHPILFLQHMVWHEGYHHGQIKLALKAMGKPLDDEEIGRVTWDVWMDKTGEVAGDSADRKTIWPSAGAVEDGEYLNGGGFQPIGDDVGRTRDNQLARTRDSSDMSFSWKQAETLDRFEDQTQLPVRCRQTVFGDVAMQLHRLRRGERCPFDLRGRRQRGR